MERRRGRETREKHRKSGKERWTGSGETDGRRKPVERQREGGNSRLSVSLKDRGLQRLRGGGEQKLEEKEKLGPGWGLLEGRRGRPSPRMGGPSALQPHHPTPPDSSAPSPAGNPNPPCPPSRPVYKVAPKKALLEGWDGCRAEGASGAPPAPSRAALWLLGSRVARSGEAWPGARFSQNAPAPAREAGPARARERPRTPAGLTALHGPARRPPPPARS